MAVYSNQDLVAQYLPKAMFTGRNLKKHPPVVVIRITLPTPIKPKVPQEHKQNGRGKTARLTPSRKGIKNTPP